MVRGGHVSFESGFSMEIIRELILMGHDMRKDIGAFGGYQAIMCDYNNKVYYGASESRQDGQAAGY